MEGWFVFQQLLGAYVGGDESFGKEKIVHELNWILGKDKITKRPVIETDNQEEKVEMREGAECQGTSLLKTPKGSRVVRMLFSKPGMESK